MLVETLSLTKRYGKFTALADCTLGVSAGEVFGLLGPNGAGKTTLLRLLLGYLRPTSGRGLVDGLDCWRHPRRIHERVSYLPGETRLFRQMRGRDVLHFFSSIRGNGMWQRALKFAERLNLDLSTNVALMSTGMKQKLALAVTLAAETPLVILDEPTSNLDPTVRGEVTAMVREIQRAGRTVIFSSHVLSEVEATCDRVVILREGRLVHTQVMHDLHLRHRIRAQLTGPMTPVPDRLETHVQMAEQPNGTLTIETDGELALLLGWLAELPLTAVRIEPIGLQTVYETFHPFSAAE